MLRRLSILCLVSAALVGCGGPENKMAMSGPPEKATPAPEMNQLAWMVGPWTGTAEMVSPSREEMMKMMPAGSPPPPASFASAGKAEWALGGHFVKNEGWYDMGPGMKINFIEYMTWDAKAGAFHSWFFSDSGEVGQGMMKFSADGKTATMKMHGHRGDGSKMTGEGTMTILGNGRSTFTWSETGPMGAMKLKGENMHGGGASTPAPASGTTPSTSTGSLEMGK